LILLDTNILLRYARAADPDFATVDAAINALHAGGESLCIVPENVYEFWATATRPITSNGLGLSVAECQVQVARMKRLFRLLPDLPTLFAEWEALVGAHACHGREIGVGAEIGVGGGNRCRAEIGVASSFLVPPVGGSHPSEPARSDRPAGFTSGPGRTDRGTGWRPSRVTGRSGAGKGPGRWTGTTVWSGRTYPDQSGRRAAYG
jgi:predicted nucleic acid-binding protein